MSALPAKYATTIDAIDAQLHTLNAHEKLEKLQRKEECLKAANTDDIAALAKQFNKKRNAKPKGRKFSYSSDKDIEDSDNDGGDQKKGPNCGCYLCGGLHFYQDYKYGKKFMEFVKKEKREARHCAPAHCSGQKTCGKKNKAYTADGNSGDDSSSSTSIASNDDSFDEEAQISRIDAKASKITPSSWIADLGASAHMTDNPTLFRELIEIRHRRIQVGGGEIWSDHKGVIELRLPNRESTLLEDCLLVPNLGVNLLSGVKVCEKGLRGSFNHNKEYFTKDEQRVIQAKQQGGVYVVSRIAPGYTERVFYSSAIDLDEAAAESGKDELTKAELEYKPPADPEQDLSADAPTVPINQPEEANENGGAEYYNEEGNKLQGETIMVDVPMADRNNGDGGLNNPGTAEQESVDSTAQNNVKNNEHVPLPSSRPASTEPVLPAPPTQHLAQSAPSAQAPSPYFLQKRKRSDSTPKFDHQTYKLICAHIARLEIKEDMEEYEECMLTHSLGTNIPAPQSYQEAVSHP
ncbi:MAG: hypothetical protein FRX48_06914 [Lasallia pustulata]|uniref:Retrovirus-related Pol polyprotein from transposon TNT 1-94-like beta-barrel domain-containing protein n=1 Tax=Lasallia pustulata TaxID=136370 RepID=A0A5M8PIW0_9LECA|nr:MAG: hypothetical protein FRX48_06914 [Lasallia pustulata]